MVNQLRLSTSFRSTNLRFVHEVLSLQISRLSYSTSSSTSSPTFKYHHSMPNASNVHHNITLGSDRAYALALSLLSGLESNASVRSQISSTTRGDINQAALPEMLEWTRRAGYEPEDFAQAGLRCIHVAGTKGKGSVCGLVEGLLLRYKDGQGKGKNADRVEVGELIGKIGTYTSPHILHVRERIRINGAPISKALFADCFFELWDRFAASSSSTTSPFPIKSERASSFSYKSFPLTAEHLAPSYFRYLTLLALHAFTKESVTTAIIETGIGGAYDSTNILPTTSLTAVGITSLGLDHLGMLGDNIESIAWHKAGIMKPSIPAFTVPQISAAESVLKAQALEKGASLCVISPLPVLQSRELKTLLEASGPFHVENASLALALTCTHLSSLGAPNIPTTETLLALETRLSMLPSAFTDHLITANPPLGRYTIINESPHVEWYIDGAHTDESIRATARWFGEKTLRAGRNGQEGRWIVDNGEGDSGTEIETVLIFNQEHGFRAGGREPDLLLEALLEELHETVRGPAKEPKVQWQPECGIPKSQWEFEHRLGRSLVQKPGGPTKRVFSCVVFCRNLPTAAPGCVDIGRQEMLADVYMRSEALTTGEGVEQKEGDGDTKMVFVKEDVTAAVEVVRGIVHGIEYQALQGTKEMPARKEVESVVTWIVKETLARRAYQKLRGTKTDTVLNTEPYRGIIEWKAYQALQANKIDFAQYHEVARLIHFLAGGKLPTESSNSDIEATAPPDESIATAVWKPFYPLYEVAKGKVEREVEFAWIVGRVLQSRACYELVRRRMGRGNAQGQRDDGEGATKGELIKSNRKRKKVMVLVTGSLHLAGSLLFVLRKQGVIFPSFVKRSM